MSRWTVVFSLCAAIGCSGADTTELTPITPSFDTFVGEWRSVTPSLEFIRLSVASKSSAMGELGARLTFSGVAWEGSGRIAGDSLVVTLSMPGSDGASSVLIAHAQSANTLRVQQRSATTAALQLTLVRD